MGITSVGASTSSSAIKAVQTGSAAGAGNVTITSVDVNKSFVQVFGTASSGAAAVSGAASAFTGTFPATDLKNWQGGGSSLSNGTNNSGGGKAYQIPSTTMNFNGITLSGGTTNLVAATVQGYLSNATTLVVSGACRWQVVEFN